MKNRLVTVAAVHTHTHTHTDTLLKNRIVIEACNLVVAGVIFYTQNLIRDG